VRPPRTPRAKFVVAFPALEPGCGDRAGKIDPRDRELHGQERHGVIRHYLHGIVRPRNLLKVLVPQDRDRVFRVPPRDGDEPFRSGEARRQEGGIVDQVEVIPGIGGHFQNRVCGEGTGTENVFPVKPPPVLLCLTVRKYVARSAPSDSGFSTNRYSTSGRYPRWLIASSITVASLQRLIT